MDQVIDKEVVKQTVKDGMQVISQDILFLHSLSLKNIPGIVIQGVAINCQSRDLIEGLVAQLADGQIQETQIDQQQVPGEDQDLPGKFFSSA